MPRLRERLRRLRRLRLLFVDRTLPRLLAACRTWIGFPRGGQFCIARARELLAPPLIPIDAIKAAGRQEAA